MIKFLILKLYFKIENLGQINNSKLNLFLTGEGGSVGILILVLSNSAIVFSIKAHLKTQDDFFRANQVIKVR